MVIGLEQGATTGGWRGEDLVDTDHRKCEEAEVARNSLAAVDHHECKAWGGASQCKAGMVAVDSAAVDSAVELADKGAALRLADVDGVVVGGGQRGSIP